MKIARTLPWLAVPSLVLLGSSAGASNGIESPDVGVVPIGRGGAWLVRADDPLAAFHNPAAMAWQRTGVHAGVHLMFERRCFTRVDENGKFVSPGEGAPAPDLNDATPNPNAEVCSDTKPFPNPQLAATLRLTDDLAIGLAVLGPHAVGNVEWPETLSYKNEFGFEQQQPAPNRFLLVSESSLLVFPTVSVGWAVTRDIAIGAGFIWGIADVEYSNFAEAVSPEDPNPSDSFKGHDELKATLVATDAFIPGFVVSGLWTVTDRFEIGAFYKWMDAVDSDVDIRVQSRYWSANGRPNTQPCNPNATPPEAPDCNITDPADHDGHVTLKLPMEAKLGARYRHPRSGVAPRPGRKVRDPMRDDLFDVEVDFTWANNSAVDAVRLRFRGDPEFPGDEIPVRGTPGFVPSNADIPHEWRDVVGIRVGGDFVVLQDLLSLRAGGFFESKGQDDEYLNLDFYLGERIGVGGGATLRLPLGISPSIDVSVAYQHTFFGTLDNGGKGKIRALSGSVVSGHRSRQFVNGGKLTNALDEIGLGASVRF